VAIVEGKRADQNKECSSEGEKRKKRGKVELTRNGRLELEFRSKKRAYTGTAPGIGTINLEKMNSSATKWPRGYSEFSGRQGKGVVKRGGISGQHSLQRWRTSGVTLKNSIGGAQRRVCPTTTSNRCEQNDGQPKKKRESGPTYRGSRPNGKPE